MEESKNATFIPNYILEKIYSTKLSGTQLSIILVICRFAHGYQKGKYMLSAGFVSDATGINLHSIKRELDNLATRKIILIADNTLQINNNINQWKGQQSPSKKEGPINEEKYLPIFNHWNQQKITVHRDITKDIADAIDIALSKWAQEAIINAIARYSEIYHDTDYFFSYNWTLVNFLKQKNALPEFMEDGQKWIAYQNKVKSKSNPDPPSEINNPYAPQCPDWL